MKIIKVTCRFLLIAIWFYIKYKKITAYGDK